MESSRRGTSFVAASCEQEWKRMNKNEQELTGMNKTSLQIFKKLEKWRRGASSSTSWLLLVPKLCAGRCTSPLLLLCYCCYEFKTCTTGSTRANSRKLHSAEFEDLVTFEHSISKGSSRIFSYLTTDSSQTLHNGLKLSMATYIYCLWQKRGQF